MGQGRHNLKEVKSRVQDKYEELKGEASNNKAQEAKNTWESTIKQTAENIRGKLDDVRKTIDREDTIADKVKAAVNEVTHGGEHKSDTQK